MADVTEKSDDQKDGEAKVDAFRQDLGPFVVAAEKTRMPMVFTDQEPGHPIIFANDAFLALTGHVREEILGKKFQTLLTAGVDAETMLIVESAFRGECKSDPEIHYKRKNGSEFWATMFVSPVCEENGTVVQQFVSIVDQTKHQQDTAQYKMLIDELNHRVKNTLATVQSIVTQALRHPAEPAAIRQAIESRLMALSRSHDLLTSSNWEGAGLHDLVDTALHPFEVVESRDERFEIVGENVHLSPKTTLSMAIAFHELATNAVKYGAFSNEAGTIRIDWTVEAEDTGSRVVIRWVERGGPKVTPPTGKGFGSWVLERGIAHELGGKVVLDYLPDGLVCTINIPISRELTE